MGLPAMNIIFAAAADESVRRAERGVVGMIVKDTPPEDGVVTTIYKGKNIPSTWKEETKQQVRLTLKGNVTPPKKVVVYTLSNDKKDYTEALDYFALHHVNWLACPTVETDGQSSAVAEWVKMQREERNKVKAVLPKMAGDHEGIVNFANETITAEGKKHTTETFCSRIAGLLAGTPINQGATFSSLPEVTDCDSMGKEELDAAIDAGKFLLFYDGEKIKVARAVNSLATLPKWKKKTWKKIKVVETMDMIYNDLILLAEDNYIGKYTNSYNNKCLLMSAIKSYLDRLESNGIISHVTLEFDLEAIKEYLMTEGGMRQDDVEAMKELELKKADTADKVFFASSMKVLDVMEDITLNITV